MKKKFRVAKAGQTTDGRAIPVEHINQMAANYNPATYNARVNLEHFKSMMPRLPRGSGRADALTPR